MSKAILGLAALLGAALLASTASAGSPSAAGYASRAHQVIRAQPRMHDGVRVRDHLQSSHRSTHALRTVVREPSASQPIRAVRAPAARPAVGSSAVVSRAAPDPRRPQRSVPPMERTWRRCAEPADQCGQLDRSGRSLR